MSQAESRPGAITPAQCRAARGLLGWTQMDLADKAGTTQRTVAAFENGENRPQAATMAKLVSALTGAGISFLDTPGGVGREPEPSNRRSG